MKRNHTSTLQHMTYMTHMCLVISGTEWRQRAKDLAGELPKKHIDMIMKGEHFVTVWEETQIETNVTLNGLS